MEFNFRLDKDMIEKMKQMDLPRSFNYGIWRNYLGRHLTEEEMYYLEEFKSESKFNTYIKKLHNKAKQKGLYIPYLTNLYGNCMFESLEHHNLFRDQEEFRKNLAYLMFIFKDKKNLFPDQESSLSELFTLTNEVEYVITRNKKIYKYNYDVMCQDLSNEYTWTRLPTQLIMMVISLFFNVRFHIISDNNDYEHIINTSIEDQPLDIYLGHIEELHYVPLEIKKNDPIEDIVPKHCNAKNNFFKWAITIWNSMNNVTCLESDNNFWLEDIDQEDKLKSTEFLDISKNVEEDLRVNFEEL